EVLAALPRELLARRPRRREEAELGEGVVPLFQDREHLATHRARGADDGDDVPHRAPPSAGVYHAGRARPAPERALAGSYTVSASALCTLKMEASAMSSSSTLDRPSRSAIVRATRSTRTMPRPVKP